MKTILIETFTHQGQDRLKLIFEYDDTLKEKAKQIEGRQWNPELKYWHIPYMEGTVAMLKSHFADTDAEIKDKNTYRKAFMPNAITILEDQKENLLYVNFPFHLKDEFKKLEGAWWHPGAKKWSCHNTQDNQNSLEKMAKRSNYNLELLVKYSDEPKKTINFPVIVKTETPDDKFLRHMRLQGKSEQTIKQYLHYTSWYLTFAKGKELLGDTSELIRRFVLEEIVKNGFGRSQQNVAISAVKLYYTIVHGITIEAEDIPRPKRKRPLPKVISQQEFLNIYKVCRNQKHRIILMLLYGCGLRRAEVCELKKADVDFERGLIYVKGKGEKFRAVNPGKHMLKQLQSYLKSYLPEYYLIEGQGKSKYTGSSIAKIVINNTQAAGIKKRVTPHTLRHSFATHQMEKGTELRLIQESMGHASSKTTEIYTYVSRKSIQSMGNLLDDLEIQLI